MESDAADLDAEIRRLAFEFLDAMKLRQGDALPHRELIRGFDFQGRRVPLLGASGIFKPAVLRAAPLSIMTAPERPGRPRPYEDRIEDDVIFYKYRGVEPDHPDNAGLRRAMTARLPLIYFHGLVRGLYHAEYPVYITGDNPGQLVFSVQCDEGRLVGRSSEAGVAESEDAARRRYITRLSRQRMHQHGFRERVLAAYRQCCAVCRIRHRPLLDAAHIIADSDVRGTPVISNGLALCKIHHAAFDHDLLGIRPDLVIEVREDVLNEVDGPMLKHGLQELHDKRILVVPHRASERPNPLFLEERYRRFREAG